MYEYILTFIYEVERFWPTQLKNLLEPSFRYDDYSSEIDEDREGRNVTRTGFTWASLLFFLNRYLVLLGHIPVMIEYFWTIGSQELKENVSGPYHHSFEFHVKALKI